jgi:hypothetical protein
MGLKEDIGVQNSGRLAQAKDRRRKAHDLADLEYNRDEALANFMYWESMYYMYNNQLQGRVNGDTSAGPTS